MQWIHHFDLFCFDFDGLLVDTESLHFQAYSLVCQRWGLFNQQGFCDRSLLHYYALAHADPVGVKKAIISAISFVEESQDDKQKIWERFYQEKQEMYLHLLQEQGCRLMSGAERLLRELKTFSIKRCVVTNSLKEQVDLIRHRQPLLDMIPVWLTREDYGQPKPSPQGYVKACSLLADSTDRVIGFEDTLKGLQALIGAGGFGINMQPVLICDPKHPQCSNLPSRQIKHFSSLEKVVF